MIFHINGQREKSIPYYAQGGAVYEAKAINSEHIITNRVYAELYGPQIYSKDLYPKVVVFNDVAYSFGSILNNTLSEQANDWIVTFGLNAEFNIYNIAKIYYEVGYVYKDLFTEDSKVVKAKIGFSLEV